MRSINLTRAAVLVAACLLLPAGAQAGEWNRGDRPLTESLDHSRTAMPRPATVGDPVGDTLGDGPVQIDASRLSVEFSDALVEIRISFATNISAPDSGQANALDGFIDIDADQNGNTGRVSHIDFTLDDGQDSGLGVEYYVDLFGYSSADGRAPLIDDGNGDVVGRVPVTITPNQVTARIPLSSLNDDGRVDVGVLIGTLEEPTDRVPNSGSVSSTPGTSVTACTLSQTSDVSPCVPDAQTLCLTANRFEVTTDWATNQGTSGVGIGEELTADTGDFYFFDDDNIEVVVKVLDACVVNDHFWIFAAGLTNVEVVMTVRDTQTGAVRTCVNPLNTPFQPIQLTDAFDCP